jgi:transcriptional regulator with XRE-family HTH domain
MQAVGLYLRDLRVAEGLTQAEAADRAGVSTKSVERWEAGKVEPALTTLAAYVKALRGSVTRAVALLLGDSDDVTREQVVSEFAPHPDETPEEAARVNRLLDLLAQGVPADEAARRVLNQQ